MPAREVGQGKCLHNQKESLRVGRLLIRAKNCCKLLQQRRVRVRTTR